MSRFQTSFHKESSGKLDELFESLTLDGKKDEFRKVVGFDADSNFKKGIWRRLTLHLSNFQKKSIKICQLHRFYTSDTQAERVTFC